MTSHNAIPYSKDIESFVKKYALVGKNLTNIFELAQAQGFQNMPNSRETFSKKYKHVVDQIKMDKLAAVSDKVYDRAINEGEFGSLGAQELILSTQAGWSKTQVNVDVDATDDDGGDAKKALLAALGLDEE